MRTLAIVAVVAAACAALIWVAPLLGAIVTVAITVGVFVTYVGLIVGGWARRRTDETYGTRKSMWGFWE